MIALAVTVATQGAASGFAAGLVTSAGFATTAAGTAGGALAGSLSAGFQAIVSKAAVSLANNKGNLAKTLKDLGSNASIKSIATSMVTAGIVSALPANVIPVAAADAKLTFAQQLQVNLVKGAINSSVSTAINSGDIGDQLKDSMLLAAVQSVGAEAATQIGIAAKTGTPSGFKTAVQLVSHAALGCGMGAVTGGSKGCAGGAVGGVVGEVVSKIYIAAQRGEHVTVTTKELEALKEQGVNFGKMAGALVALGTSTDVNAAIATADNAARNNALDTIWDVLNVLYDGGKIAYGYYKNDKGLIEEGFVDLASDAASTLIPFVPAGASKLARETAENGYTVLYRAVKQDELDDIVRSGGFRNPLGIEVKYFSTSAEGAASYSKQASKSFGDGPYTIVETRVKSSEIRPEMRAQVDRGIETVVVPSELLNQLARPGIWTSSPLPRK